MANAYALVGVTAVLRDLLRNGLTAQDVNDVVTLDNAMVTTLPPERLGRTDDLASRLNLYLYRTTPNTGWTNERMPSRTAGGERCSNPHLALDLHYLLSAYGRNDLDAEVMLGVGMQVFHEVPILTRNLLSQVLRTTNQGGVLPAGFGDKNVDELAEQVEQVRISPYHHDTEEMSRLWSSLNAGLRPSALYKVTVVLIESRVSTRQAPPVRSRTVRAEPLRRPRIERLLSNPAPADPLSEFAEGGVITDGHRVALVGRGLRGSVTALHRGELVLTEPNITLTGSRLEFDVPGAAPGARWWPGIYGLQVVHRILRDPEDPAAGTLPFEMSNTAGFALSPSLVPPAQDPVELVQGAIPGNPDTPVEGVVRVRFAHDVGVEQTVELMLNEIALAPPADRPAFAYTFEATPPGGNAVEVDELDFAIEGVRQAIYLVRVRVDGVVSDVEVASPGPDAEINALAQEGILSHPALNLTP